MKWWSMAWSSLVSMRKINWRKYRLWLALLIIFIAKCEVLLLSSQGSPTFNNYIIIRYFCVKKGFGKKFKKIYGMLVFSTVCQKMWRVTAQLCKYSVLRANIQNIVGLYWSNIALHISYARLYLNDICVSVWFTPPAMTFYL